MNTSAQTHRRSEPRPEVGWFYHLHDGDLADCQGTVEMPLHIDPRPNARGATPFHLSPHPQQHLVDASSG